MTGSLELIDQYRQIHAERVYGASSVKNLRFLRPEIRLLRPRSILDYGCGQSPLLDYLDLGYPAEMIRYDPAIPAYADKPEKPADLLINIDVLEHVEEHDLDAVLGEMAGLCRDAIIIVDTEPAALILPDGRNAHVTLHPHDWWRERLSRHFGPLFAIATTRRRRAGFRTWPRSTSQTLRYFAMRGVETMRHYAGRAVAKTLRSR